MQRIPRVKVIAGLAGKDDGASQPRRPVGPSDDAGIKLYNFWPETASGPHLPAGPSDAPKPKVRGRFSADRRQEGSPGSEGRCVHEMPHARAQLRKSVTVFDFFRQRTWNSVCWEVRS